MRRKTSNTDSFIHYLTNNTRKELQMIDRIIGDDEQSRKEFDAYLEVWEKSADLKDFEKIDVKEGWNRVRSKMKITPVSKKIPMRRYFIRIAAIFILALGLAYLFTQIMKRIPVNDMIYSEVSTTGTQKIVNLPDGSSIHLNKASKIIYNSSFGDLNRDIILEGEAYFEVNRNENLPFRVHSLNSIVEVLGTSFDVRVDSDQVTVGVVSGKVALYESKDTGNRVELLPDNTGIFTARENRLTLQKHFDRNRIAWHTGEFVFRNKPLKDVCQILADYYHLHLITDDNVQFVESITLTLSTESLDRILYTINSALTENIELISKDDLLIVKKL